jgi:CRISPR-associated protein Cmr2
MTTYTAISFAPVQGFIEKSRKLRDLFGASLILSYLSQKLAAKADDPPEREVISPALINVQKGMPNRILIRGLFERNEVERTLIDAWGEVLNDCQRWLERNVSSNYSWDREWLKWKQYSWEIFWGTGETPGKAMQDLERRKLKRDWIGVNWTGDSSSLTGTDAIAWPRLGQLDSTPGKELSSDAKAEQRMFYEQLAQKLEEPSSDGQLQGKFLDPHERLSIPELVKRLITRYEDIGYRFFERDFLGKSFAEMVRLPQVNQPGHWTGWFMGDGDRIGKTLKEIADQQEDRGLKDFSEALRNWGINFKECFPPTLGRVVYAGGDDFLGVIYSQRPKEPIRALTALEWLLQLRQQWATHEQNIGLSVGFVWAGHQVPQRDILQHCREAEKRAKSLGRDRVTIRVVFNSGQSVQWTCPWNYLDILTKYRDREGKKNWTHLYSDWAQLKARHSIELKDTAEHIDDRLALAIFDLYFQDSDRFKEHRFEIFQEEDTPQAIIQWIDGLVNVGWQLCSDI